LFSSGKGHTCTMQNWTYKRTTSSWKSICWIWSPRSCLSEKDPAIRDGNSCLDVLGPARLATAVMMLGKTEAGRAGWYCSSMIGPGRD
jgi:hypothetical protein